VVRIAEKAILRRTPNSLAAKTRAYSSIKREITSAVLRQGSPLTERDLAERFHLSRTPVREIIQRLHYEGLVELVPNRGAFVRRIDAEQILDIFYAREAIEGMAARLAAARHRADQLEPIAELFAGLRDGKRAADVARMLDAGRRLHDFIIEASANKPLQAAYEPLRSQAMLIRSITREIPEIELASYRASLSILDAVRARNPSAAEQRMREHLVTTREKLLGEIFRRA
jgi:DNA-binding GntR family transcriptional regulator